MAVSAAIKVVYACSCTFPKTHAKHDRLPVAANFREQSDFVGTSQSKRNVDLWLS